MIPMPNSENVYTEASSWLRLANSLCWQISAIFVPLSVGGFVYAVEHPDTKYWLFFGSNLLWFMWVYMVMLYGRSAIPCRAALESLEKELPKKQSFYTKQGILFNGIWGSKYLLFVSSTLFFMAWLLFLFLNSQCLTSVS
jgi:hypothetical protein